MFEELEYREIPHTDGRYMISINGDVWDKKLNRHVAQNKTRRGWVRCHVWIDGVRKVVPIHRLVMLSFVGESDLTVNHKDGNKDNNNISNLEYMTVAEQNEHRSYVLKVGNRVAVKCIENGKTYDTIKAACNDLGIKYKDSHISAVIKHQYGFKSSHGYHFEKA